MRTYKLSDIKKVCEAIYGRAIADSTWRRWKSKLQFISYQKEVSEQKMEQLLTLANMKRENPYERIILKKVIDKKMDALNKLTTNGNYKIHLIPEQCQGSEIKEIVYMVTGRKPNRTSFYRWGKKVNIPFSANRKYKKDELMQFISNFL